MSTNGKTQLQIRRPIFPELQSNCFEEARERSQRCDAGCLTFLSVPAGR